MPVPVDGTFDYVLPEEFDVTPGVAYSFVPKSGPTDIQFDVY